jgi:nucleoside-diphosphate-sugar epimerase
MSSILVTGATGFVGRHLCSLLARHGYTVYGTLRQAEPPADFPAHITWVRVGDIGPNTDWSVALNGMDYVIHLAALAHQMDIQGKGKIEEYMRVNAAGTRCLVQAISTTPTVRRLIYVSSVSAVKSLSNQAISEGAPCEPDTDYGRSKRAAEQSIEEILQDSRTDWCIIRPPLVYGPGNPGNMARLLKLINAGIPLPLAAINSQRSFVFIGNMIDALERCLWHPGASRRTFLISDGEDISTPELMRRLAQYTGKRLYLFPVPIELLDGLGHIGDLIGHFTGRSIGLDSYSIKRLTGSLTVDSKLLRKAIEWYPPFTMDQGLATTLITH